MMLYIVLYIYYVIYFVVFFFCSFLIRNLPLILFCCNLWSLCSIWNSLLCVILDSKILCSVTHTFNSQNKNTVLMFFYFHFIYIFFLTLVTVSCVSFTFCYFLFIYLFIFLLSDFRYFCLLSEFPFSAVILTKAKISLYIKYTTEMEYRTRRYYFFFSHVYPIQTYTCIINFSCFFVFYYLFSAILLLVLFLVCMLLCFATL